MKRLARRLRVVALSIVLGASGAVADPAVHAEHLARQVYFESLDYDEVRALGPGAAERLMALLEDPSEVRHHANCVLMLGMLAAPGSYDALTAWERGFAGGEVDRAAFRARRVLPYAMGHLARHEGRALEWLGERSRRPGDPDWSFGPLHGVRLAAQLRRAAIRGLALSGQPAAGRELRRLAGDSGATTDPRTRETVREALIVYDRVAREGVEAALPRGREAR